MISNKMWTRNRGWGLVLLAVFAMGSCFSLFRDYSFPPEKHNLKEQTFAHLSSIREEKKQEVVQYFEAINEQAQSISNDNKMQRFFSLLAKGQVNSEMVYELDKHYVTDYGNFYDILFVDVSGYVFYSIRKEDDYQKNIFTSESFSTLKLVKSLQDPQPDGFVEYEFYPPSNEAAAFFTVPVYSDGKVRGWFILQCETNTVNTILTDRRDLGRTGEVYLVNTESLMLSESRFMGDSTILQQQVDTVAVREALELREGEKVILDYRGVTVFSSFEKFELFGASWIIIVEIDEDEVITEYFQEHKRFFIPQIIDRLSDRKPRVRSQITPGTMAEQRVDMNEFAKAENNSYLFAKGVATCTAIAVSYPGKFGYLAHIAPTNEIYIDNAFTKYFLKENYHRFLSDLLGRIRYYEIYPYELKKLQFVIVAPHEKSFAKAVDIILSHGIELANIKFLYNPKAQSVNVTMLPPRYDVQVTWDTTYPAVMDDEYFDNIGEIVKKIINYDAELKG